jgi:hypothetical protein
VRKLLRFRLGLLVSVVEGASSRVDPIFPEHCMIASSHTYRTHELNLCQLTGLRSAFGKLQNIARAVDGSLPRCLQREVHPNRAGAMDDVGAALLKYMIIRVAQAEAWLRNVTRDRTQTFLIPSDALVDPQCRYCGVQASGRRIGRLPANQGKYAQLRI